MKNWKKYTVLFMTCCLHLFCIEHFTVPPSAVPPCNLQKALAQSVPAPSGYSTRPSSKNGHAIHNHPRQSPSVQTLRTSRPKPVR